MSPGIARRRAAKSARRKQLLAERRKMAATQQAGSGAGLARRMAAAKIRCCMMHKGTLEDGGGAVVLAREGSSGLVVASFLLDTFCVGVKDATLQQMEEATFDACLAVWRRAAPMTNIDPTYARKLIRETVAYGRSLGFEPPAEYAAAELLFGDLSAESCDAIFTFGVEGKPCYVPGPTETPSVVRRRLEHLRSRLGEGGFDFVEPVDDLDVEIAAGAYYDADEAPDPEAWLELDEDTRIELIRSYHRREGIDPPAEMVHAALHAAIETQAAAGEAVPVQRAIDRLIAEGLDRHQAIHAVGSVMFEHFNEAARKGGAEAESAASAYYAAVEALTADEWRRRFGPDAPDEPS
jgi:hypothetical protein